MVPALLAPGQALLGAIFWRSARGVDGRLCSPARRHARRGLRGPARPRWPLGEMAIGAGHGQGYLLLAGADRERSQELRPRQGNQAEGF